MKPLEEYSVDILVIGGGLAGLMAALAAHCEGKSVLVVSKAPIGRSGNTLVSGGGISAVTTDPGNDVDCFVDDLLKSGKGMNNPVLAKKLATCSPLMLEKLEQYGVSLIQKNGAYKRRRPPGHSIARNIPTEWGSISYLNRGLSFSLPLYKSLQKEKVTMIDGVSICKIITDEKGVLGAVGLNRHGEEVRFRAPNIVLATGGGGHIYSRTNNTSDITADGLAMALEAGCQLQDMEQVQFYPTMMFNPLKVTISNPLFGVGAVLRNSDGERFMQKYDDAGDMATRDSMAQAIFQEIESGKGVNGCVYVDCTGIPAETLKEQFADFCQFLGGAGINPTKDLLQVSPCVHYFLGGIVIDEMAGTNIPGLFAAGEICGGIHGANRLSGAALMEACVYGWQAGKSASSSGREIPTEKAMHSETCLGESRHSERDISEINRTKQKLRTAMWQKVGLIRNEKGLREMEEILFVESRKMASYAFSRHRIELSNMIKVAQAIVASALFRQESRGAHYRSDYPKPSPNYDGNVLTCYDGDAFKLRFEPTQI